ncbi:MAG: hypothetical protein ABIJ08_01265 [Nanoarchaeota archaeon]
MIKKGELNVSMIVIVILAITVLGLFLGFFRDMFGVSQQKMAGQLAEERDPPIPNSNDPITLSKPRIDSKSGSTEAVKISVFNPTNADWTFRDYLEFEEGCDLDGVCNLFDCTIDPDCPQDPSLATCDPDGICVRDVNCTNVPGDDIDCGPTEGVRLLIECENELNLKTETNPKTIKVQDYDTFVALLRINENASAGDYLCKIGIIADGAELYTKDLIIDLK